MAPGAAPESGDDGVRTGLGGRPPNPPTPHGRVLPGGLRRGLRWADGSRKLGGPCAPMTVGCAPPVPPGPRPHSRARPCEATDRAPSAPSSRSSAHPARRHIPGGGQGHEWPEKSPCSHCQGKLPGLCDPFPALVRLLCSDCPSAAEHACETPRDPAAPGLQSPRALADPGKDFKDFLI